MPTPNLLISAKELNDCIADDAVAVLDVRPLATYRAGHLPGACWFSLAHAKTMVRDTPDLVEARLVAAQLGAAAVRPEQRVVVVDETLSLTATHVFWALEYAGQAAVAILDGGIGAWREAGYGLTTQPTRAEPCEYTATPRSSCRATGEDLDGALLDVRGPQEYGAGHIAGAHHLCWTELVSDPRYMTLRTAAEMVECLRRAGITPAQTVIPYCRSGGRASLVYFVLRWLGWPDVRLYDGSMNDWLLQERTVQV